MTVAEMLCVGSPVICCDEISTGLDGKKRIDTFNDFLLSFLLTICEAATTFDIAKWLGAVTRLTETIKLVSLLQPPPETVALFDELVLLSEGKVIYAGPVEAVVDYFMSLGYDIPERMDVADWLQALPTKDGAQFLRGGEGNGSKHLSTDEFMAKFYESPRGCQILETLDSPSRDGSAVKSWSTVRYRNPTFRSLKLLVRRELILWWRDKYQIQATAMKGMWCWSGCG